MVLVFLALLSGVQPLPVRGPAAPVRPGDVILLTIAAAQPATPVVRAFGRSWPGYREDARTWRVLVGVDLETAPGPYTATVSSEGARATYPFTVRRRVFPTRRLTVDPNLVNPPPEARERIDREARELAKIWEKSATERLWSDGFIRPVPDRANSAFGTRSVYNGEPRSQHTGADFLSPPGRPVKAPSRGRIVLVGSRYFTGNTVVIDHGQGLFSLLAHLSEIDVTPGAMVAAGDIVGKVGATGRVTGPHLHWTVRLNGARVDPLSLLGVWLKQPYAHRRPGPPPAEANRP